jgi:hypothetical protein
MDKAFAYGGKQRENKGSINGNIYLARVLKASLFGEKGTTFDFIRGILLTRWC